MKKEKYIPSRIKSFVDALEGLKHVLSTQQNARIHAAITLVVFLFAIVFKISRLEWIAIVLVIGLVWTAEIFNTAVEVIVDMVSPEHSQGARIIKDVSAGAVLVSALISILVGILVFGPRLLDLVTNLFTEI
jgi:diacylglycerol kinase